MDMKGKKVLLFTSVLFSYHIKIKNAIEKLGAEVHLYDERNNPSSLQKIIIRKARFLIQKRTDNYYRFVCMKESSFEPNYILFVSPEAVTCESLKQLKKTYPNATFILYMWDSVKNKKVDNILPYFDRKYSFDPEDCKKYDMILRPLFYSNEQKGEMPDEICEYDFSFIGTVHSDRAKILWNIKEYCDTNKLSYYFYLFVPGKMLLQLRMRTDRYFRKWEKKYIHTESITKEEVDRVSSKTRCVIDINHPKQTGLTMRTIEMLGMQRKIATTNVNVQNYDFYRPENQILLDRKNISISKEMIISKYMKIEDEILEKYSIDYWAKELFNLKL